MDKVKWKLRCSFRFILIKPRLILLIIGIIVSFVDFSRQAYAAAEENANLWTKFDVDGYLSRQQHLKYWLDAQLRFISKHNQFESAQFEALLGYGYSPEIDFWLGYRRTQNPLRTQAPERNTVWEEVDWLFINCDNMKWIWRTRFEQERPTDNVVWLLRLRQRLKVIFPNLYKKNMVPAIWNEFFFNLKETPYTTHYFYSQNRLFLGFDVTITNTQKLEIGYLNQLLFNSEAHRPNQMNHIFYVDYDFDFI